jgi:hypothetical protein
VGEIRLAQVAAPLGNICSPFGFEGQVRNASRKFLKNDALIAAPAALVVASLLREKSRFPKSAVCSTNGRRNSTQVCLPFVAPQLYVQP